MNVDHIREHISRYHPQVSHYRREHAPNRKYLSNELTIRGMHSEYLKTYPDFPCSYEMYRKCISAENISFTKLGEEQCEVCLTYDNSHDRKTCRSNKENNQNDSEDESQATDSQCNACVQRRNHIERARKARKLYRQDADTKWSDDYNVRSPDLQKVMMLHRMPGCKTAAFTSRVYSGLQRNVRTYGKALEGEKKAPSSDMARSYGRAKSRRNSSRLCQSIEV